MRKAFKVATVFTGTAAFAAGFAPAAVAATGRAAASHWNCAIGPRTKATVFWWPSSKNHGPTCVGDANQNGAPAHLGTFYQSYCPGNNKGWFDTSVVDLSYKIHPGQTKHAIYLSVHDVFLSGFSGSDTCAT
jgi:hypothetical protein